VDIGDLHPRRYFATIAVVLGLLFALIGGEDGGALWQRILQWQLQSCVPMALLLLAHLGLAHMPWFEHLSPWWRLLCSGLIGAALFAPAAALIDAILLGEGAAAMAPGSIAGEFLALAPPVALTWLAINAPFLMGLRLRRAEGAPAGERTEPAGAVKSLPFMALVPAKERGEVYYLEAELHYLAVFTPRGRSLILYNLRDAAGELECAGVSGIQTHRAFWVALAAVTSFRRSGRQGLVRTRDGAEIPVSRRRLAEVEAAVERELLRRSAADSSESHAEPD
jgi:hypothetical protein